MKDETRQEKTITGSQLRKRLQESLKSVKPGDMQAINQKLCEHLKFATDNYDALEADAKQQIDGTMNGFQKDLGLVLDKLPDSRDKRILKRLHRGMLGKRVMVDLLLKELETSPILEDDNIAKTRMSLIDELQRLTDFFCDICDNTLRDSAAFAQLSLLGMCVTELVVALHLAYHFYTNQAYSHLRTVIECVDKIELFRRETKWADIWYSGDGRAIWKELSPKKVRVKLGKPTYDPVYGLLSDLGPHGSFQAVQARTYRSLKQSSKGNPLIQQWLGSCPAEHHVIFINGGLFYGVYLVLLQTVKSFGHFLNAEEV